VQPWRPHARLIHQVQPRIVARRHHPAHTAVVHVDPPLQTRLPGAGDPRDEDVRARPVAADAIQENAEALRRAGPVAVDAYVVRADVQQHDIRPVRGEPAVDPPREPGDRPAGMPLVVVVEAGRPGVPRAHEVDRQLRGGQPFVEPRTVTGAVSRADAIRDGVAERHDPDRR
jgi:hypothetical protein